MTLPQNLRAFRSASASSQPERNVSTHKTNPGLGRPALAFAITAFAIALGSASAIAGETVLYSFCSQVNCADGLNPVDSLILDGSGNLFGTTEGGGHRTKGGGTGSVVFELAPNGTETVLHSFSGSPDGSFASGSLVADSSGNLYGATTNGGSNGCRSGCGTIFEVAPNGTETLPYTFCSGGFPCPDGRSPTNGSLLMDSSGNLYGEASGGGANQGGTVFQLATGGALTTLYSFCAMGGCADGQDPSGGLTSDSSGNLYGTTFSGGSGSACPFTGICGTVFELTSNGTETALYSFCSLPNCTDGRSPEGAVIRDSSGNLYGTTSIGGTIGQGTVFEVAPNGTETVLYSFCSLANCSDGAMPVASLIEDRAGNFYGTASSGGGATDCGVVFKIAPGGAETVIYAFQGGSDGCSPTGSLIADNLGNVYGTTSGGGANNSGTVFELASVISVFAGTPGQPNCYGQSVAALATQYGGLPAAAAALGYPNQKALQAAIKTYCQ